MTDKGDVILNEVARYYSAKLAEYGETPRGVDWNSEESQILRFQQLIKVVGFPAEKFSINDLGCGYGSLLDFLSSRFDAFFYHGYDVSADMIQAAKLRHAPDSRANFVTASFPWEMADYGVASGIFNVRVGYGDGEWRAYMNKTLDALDRTSTNGFAFNCLTSYSDLEKMHSNLYYPDPCDVFDYCKRRYSRHVALLHDYGLYEFTILVRKNLSGA